MTQRPAPNIEVYNRQRLSDKFHADVFAQGFVAWEARTARAILSAQVIEDREYNKLQIFPEILLIRSVNCFHWS